MIMVVHYFEVNNNICCLEANAFANADALTAKKYK